MLVTKMIKFAAVVVLSVMTLTACNSGGGAASPASPAAAQSGASSK